MLAIIMMRRVQLSSAQSFSKTSYAKPQHNTAQYSETITVAVATMTKGAQ